MTDQGVLFLGAAGWFLSAAVCSDAGWQRRARWLFMGFGVGYLIQLVLALIPAA